MSDYETEEQQVEAIKKWWKENGNSVLLGVAIGVAVLLSWRGYQGYQENRLADASNLYNQLSVAQDAKNIDDVNLHASTLREDYSDTSFSVMGSLQQAKLLVDTENFTAAQEQLQWVVDSSSASEGVQILAGLRLARVIAAQEKYKDALAVLPKSTSPAFVGLLEETRGDIHLAAGENDKALDAYLRAKGSRASIGNPTLLKIKIDDLTPADVDSSATKDAS